MVVVKSKVVVVVVLIGIVVIIGVRRTGQFFLGGLSHLCPKIFLTVPEKLL